MSSIEGVGKPAYQTLTDIEIESMPVDLAAFYLAISQTNSLDEQIKDRLETIRGKQKLISEGRKMMAQMKSLKAKAGKGSSAMPEDLRLWLDEHGINYENKASVKSKWDLLETELDSFTKKSGSNPFYVRTHQGKDSKLKHGEVAYLNEINGFKTRLKNATTEDARKKVLDDFCAFVETHKNDQLAPKNVYHGTTLGDQMKKRSYTANSDDKLKQL